MLLFYVSLYFLRRAIFVITIYLLEEHLWLQITIQMLSTLVVLITLLATKPLESKRSNRIEVFNECTILGLIYLLSCFTDLIPDASVRSNLGLLYLSISFFNIAVHMAILLWESGRALKRCFRRRLEKRRLKLKK